MSATSARHSSRSFLLLTSASSTWFVTTPSLQRLEAPLQSAFPVLARQLIPLFCFCQADPDNKDNTLLSTARSFPPVPLIPNAERKRILVTGGAGASLPCQRPSARRGSARLSLHPVDERVSIDPNPSILLRAQVSSARTSSTGS